MEGESKRYRSSADVAGVDDPQLAGIDAPATREPQVALVADHTGEDTAQANRDLTGDSEDAMPIVRMRVAISDVWPGFSRLYFAGQPGGLALALAFAVGLNSALVVWFLWPATITSTPKLGLGLLVATVWLVGYWDSQRFRAGRSDRRVAASQVDLFLAARREYLRGEWAAAERRLHRMITQCPQDVSARLMLATLLRHQGRLEETKEQLRRLQRWRAASDWTMEVRREWELVARAEMASKAGVATSGADSTNLRHQKRATRAIRNVSAFGRAA